jgi:N-methylhydantoinase B
MTRKPVKDLTAEVFNETYDCDRFTATVLNNRYRYIVGHVCTGLLTRAFSLILRDWYDFATTISGPPHLNYPMVAVSNSLMVFIGTMPYAVKNTVEEYGVDDIEAGDVLVCNDPYRTGTHVADNCFIRPVFYQGKIVAFINLQAHLLDMGGSVPLGFSAEKIDIYENGLSVPPSLLYKKDKPYPPTWKLYFDNTRYGDVLLPDIKTIYENLRLGERLLLESIEKYGLDACWGAMRYTCDMSEDAMIEGIKKIPDGVYEGESLVDADAMDDSEEYRVCVKLLKHEDKIEVDLSGTARQARTCINGGWLDTSTMLAVTFKYLADPHGSFNSGSFRPIDIVLPEGTIVSALPPDGAIFLYWESTHAVMTALLKALKDALGEDAMAGDFTSLSIHSAVGLWPDGRPWFTMAQLGGEHGPWGGTKAANGDNVSAPYDGNCLDPPTETIESDVPCVLMRKEYLIDSGGPGIHRGGCSVLKDSLWLLPGEHRSMPLHLKHPTGFGVYGGRDGRSGGVWLFEPEVWKKYKAKYGQIPVSIEAYRDAIPVGGRLNPETHIQDPNGDYFWPWREKVWRIGSDYVFRYQTNGGGGWGDPFQKDPELVRKEVRDKYVSIEGAQRDYGVVISGTDDPHREPEKLKVDWEATRKLREKHYKKSQK